MTSFKLLKGCDGTRSLCCLVSQQAATGLGDHSRSQWSTREGISKQLLTVTKDTKKTHSALRAPLQICCPGWVGGKVGDSYQQATEAAARQLHRLS